MGAESTGPTPMPLEVPALGGAGGLEREHAQLRVRLQRMTLELEAKNRLLAASLDRERRLQADAAKRGRLAALGEATAVVAHEVRSPLGAMELFAGLLVEDLQAQPAALGLVRHVARGIDELNHLVANVLAFTGAAAPRGRAIDCCQLVDEVLRTVVDPTPDDRVQVERRFTAPPPLARADVDLVRPVLLNLLRNAVQAMPDGGVLSLRVWPVGGHVRVSVGDSGPGIAPTDHELIFRPFYTTRTRGAGLGLAVARDLVQAMGGRLSVASEVGRGATFTVALPAA